ncbi:PTS sugar transporter subunit IIC [Companilactobacillus sp. HBUAS59544]|jgi:PTS system cellobiose-specific IIC component|uniref:PTS sugar transporter subunit IIC n=1 Tax=Companilactobacillus sp. HBUAS59544 TaxID=3109363 RepID=UPI002FF343E9
METKKGLLDKLTSFIENKVSPPLVKMSKLRYLEALQSTFLTLMPYMIIGATATLVLNLGSLFGASGGLNIPAAQKAIDSVIKPISPILLQLVFVSINLIALLVSILNGFYLGKVNQERKEKEINPVVSAILSGVSFLCFIDWGTLSKNFDYPAYIMGSPSLFAAIIISIVAVELYTWFVKKHIVIKMPEGVPPMIAAAFTGLIPVTAVVIIFAILGQGIPNFDFLTLFNKLFSLLVVGGSNWFTQFIAFIMDRVLWFVGLHGSNIVGSVMGPIWTKMITDNVAAFAAHKAIPFQFTEQWINNYVRVSLFPVALLASMSKVKRFNVLGKLSLPGTIFNIAEPIMYGLPIVLNPLMFVPWVLGFGVIFLINVVLAYLNLAPAMVAMTVWVMPAPLAAFLGSGFNVWALVLSCINFVIVFIMFYPFFKVMEKQELEKELEETATLQENSDN